MKARDLMVSAATILLDEDAVRWPRAELASWMDEGVSQIISVKPSAASTLILIPLSRGTRQSLPDDPSIVQLLDIIRNAEGDRGAAGRMVRATTRAELDTNQPRWHDPSYVPFAKEVRQFVFDELLPRDFFVFPGNDGFGSVEAAVSKVPATVMSRATGDLATLDAWDIPIGLPDHYQSALLDYVLYRAFSKEDPAASLQRATTHYQTFATAIGLKSQVEASTSPGKKS